jgi:hypothetical protein
MIGIESPFRVVPAVLPAALLVHDDVRIIAEAMMSSVAAVTSVLVAPALGASLMRIQWVGITIEGSTAQTNTCTLIDIVNNDAGQRLTIRTVGPQLGLLWRWQSHAPRRSRRHTRQAPQLERVEAGRTVDIAGLGAAAAVVLGAEPSVFTDVGLARMAGLPTTIVPPMAVVAALLDGARHQLSSCVGVTIDLHDVAYSDDQLVVRRHAIGWALERSDTQDVIADLRG